MSEERGVFSADYTSDAGHEVLVAKDAEGRKVASATVVEGADRNRVIHRMWLVLDAIDGFGSRAGPTLTVVDVGAE